METLNDKVTELRRILEGLLIELENRDKEIDIEVVNQHSRFYKFWCFCIYGHLYDKKGICRRCGKEKRI